ncbi:MAG: hypothetical protein Q7K45_00925 [Nanoarchaeota archaeon]|nr:hypothetical protein [Nanoarchaeota archaeon]
MQKKRDKTNTKNICVARVTRKIVSGRLVYACIGTRERLKSVIEGLPHGGKVRQRTKRW